MKRNAHNLAAFSESRARAAGLRRGFTLVEVMVAIAIALALIVGISEIFAMAQKTTGGGTTLLKMNATERSIQSTLRQDFQGINVDSATSPGLVIVSNSVAAFRNKQDQLESRDTGLPPDPRNLNNPNNTGPAVIDTTQLGFPNGIFSTNGRIHRQDRLCMFVRNTIHRQTADAPNLTSQTTTQEGFVWYGHLALLNDAGITDFDPKNPSTMLDPTTEGFMNPGTPSIAGQPKNDNNEFASSWVLGRQVIGMTSVDTGETMYRPLIYSPHQVPMSLLGRNMSTSNAGNNQSNSVPLYSSRYDLSLSTSAECQTGYRNISSSDIPWYEQISGMQCDLTSPDITLDQRYNANLFPTKPVAAKYIPRQFLSAAAALTAPAFVRGCTQFIVEYAGNYVTQDQDSSPGNSNYGQVLSGQADPSGKIDFIPIPVKNANGTQSWARQIRWYGFPRDTMSVDINTGIPSPGQDGAITSDSGKPYITYDVVPLCMFLKTLGMPKQIRTFERNPTVFTSQSIDMRSGSAFPFRNINHSNKALPIISSPYICAWDSSTPAGDLPKLIRITIAIDEPNGRLSTEQTFEYIFELPN